MIVLINHYVRSTMNECQNNRYLEDFPLGMAYVPWQHLTTIYENLHEAYLVGTIFPELNKPFTGRRCVN
ncbi:MAG: spore coat associated protein CotJA [Lachnospiraceae bacterium]